ncbi:MAG: regulatory protein IclR [Variovorax sp.]|nr:regulatory protein IclR [Variovorax sp.]
MASDHLFVQSLAKGMGLLETLGSRPGPLSLADLAELTGMDRSTTQRMAHTLVQLGYIEKGANGRGFVLGRKVLDRTFDYLRNNPLVERATPILTDLQREVGERVDLSLFDDLSIIYAWRRQTKRQTFFATLVGRRIPCYCSSGGRAILSHLSEERVDDILARSSLEPLTPKTETDVAVIKRRIDQAREANYALALEETLLGEIAMGCAILDHDRQPIAALHIAGSLSEWTVEAFVQRFAPLAIEAARALGGGLPR